MQKARSKLKICKGGFLHPLCDMGHVDVDVDVDLKTIQSKSDIRVVDPGEGWVPLLVQL